MSKKPLINLNELVINEALNASALPSPIDDRDWVFERREEGDPNQPYYMNITKYDLRQNMSPIIGQEGEPLCSAWSAIAIKEYYIKNKNENTDVIQLSPYFIYNHRVNKPLRGMYGRDVMNILKTKGILPMKNEPENGIYTDELYTTAFKYSIYNYFRVLTLEGLKVALIECGPCYLSLPLHNSGPQFWRQDISNNAVFMRGHAVVVVGFNDEGFILRNSWGPTWNGDGHTLFPYDDWNLHWECWTIIDKIE